MCWLGLQSLLMASRHTVAAAAAASRYERAHPFNIILWRIGSNKTTTEPLSRYFFSAANSDGTSRMRMTCLDLSSRNKFDFFLLFNSGGKNRWLITLGWILLREQKTTGDRFFDRQLSSRKKKTDLHVTKLLANKLTCRTIAGIRNDLYVYTRRKKGNIITGMYSIYRRKWKDILWPALLTTEKEKVGGQLYNFYIVVFTVIINIGLYTKDRSLTSSSDIISNTCVATCRWPKTFVGYYSPK